MKKTYFSVFMPGLERPVEAMLRKEGGVAVEHVFPGAAVYRSVGEPRLPYMLRTYLLLFQMKPMASVDDAVKRLLATGGWLDRFPYEETQGKRFRIVTAEGDRLVAAKMRYVDMLERAICEQTGMRTQRERPEVELWVLLRPEAAYFLWRLDARAPKKDGQLRADVAAVTAFLLGAAGRSAAVLGASGPGLAQALSKAGAKATWVTAEGAREAPSGVRVAKGSAGHTGLADAGFDAAALCLTSGETADEARSALFETRRILKDDAPAAVVAPLDGLEGAIRAARGFRVEARYPLTLGGRPGALFLLRAADMGGGE